MPLGELPNDIACVKLFWVKCYLVSSQMILPVSNYFEWNATWWAPKWYCLCKTILSEMLLGELPNDIACVKLFWVKCYLVSSQMILPVWNYFEWNATWWAPKWYYLGKTTLSHPWDCISLNLCQLIGRCCWHRWDNNSFCGNTCLLSHLGWHFTTIQ